MDYSLFEKLRTSQQLASELNLGDLIEFAREHKETVDELEKKRTVLEKEIQELNKQLADIIEEFHRISMGGLLLNAIGIKVRDNAEPVFINDLKT